MKDNMLLLFSYIQEYKIFALFFNICRVAPIKVNRAVLLIRIVEMTDISAFDVIQNLFPDKNKDFIISINENDIALVKETKPDTPQKAIEDLASSIADTISGFITRYLNIQIYILFSKNRKTVYYFLTSRRLFPTRGTFFEKKFGIFK